MSGWDAGSAGIDPERVAELLVDVRGRVPGRRGSGYRVSATAVLTAAHVVRNAARVRVRFNADQSDEWLTEGSVAWSDLTVDVAVVTIPARPQDEGQVAPVAFGRVAERDAVLSCSAMGFPRFKLRNDPAQSLDDGSPSQYRDSEHALGVIAVLSNRRQGTLEVSVPPPERDPDLDRSPWEGMSGAAVFSAGKIIGLLAEHHRADGLGRLAATRVDRWYERLAGEQFDQLRTLLPVLPTNASGLADVVPLPTPARMPYQATIAELSPEELLDRDAELEDLAVFATSVTGPGYRWQVGAPWAGKTALTAYFMQRRCPPQVDCVAYFLERRRSEAHATQFLQVVNAQLAHLLNERPDQLGQLDDQSLFLELWLKAAQRAEHHNRHLLLVVDGLDEDLHITRQPSVAQLLPSRVGGHAHVLVSSRRHPELPSDVPADHPLRRVTPVELLSSPHAAELARRANQDLDELLGHRDTEPLVEHVLGLLTAAQGALGIDDLIALTRRVNPTVSRPRVARLVEQEIARVVRPTGRPPARRYVFAHDTLRDESEAAFGIDLDAYRHELYDWADHYRRQGWPAERTPPYLFETYPTLLARHDPGHLEALYTDLAYLEAAIQAVGVDHVNSSLHAAIGTRPADRGLRRLSQLVDRETPRLRRPGDIRGYATRQLSVQALEVGDDEFVERALHRLNTLPRPQLLPRWTTVRTTSDRVHILSSGIVPKQAVAISADGTHAVTGGRDGTARVWNLTSGEQLHDLPGHSGGVTAIAISADGTRTVTGSPDGTVRVWNLASGEQLHDLQGHSHEIWSAATNLDGTRGVIGSRDGTARVWDLVSGTRLLDLPGHTGGVTAVAISADGSRAVTGGSDETARVWDLTFGGELHRFHGHMGEVTAVGISADDTRVVTGTGLDGRVRVWNLRPPQFGNLLFDSGGRFLRGGTAVGVSADGAYAITWGVLDGRVRMLELRSEEKVYNPLGHTAEVTAVAVSSKAARVGTSGSDGTRVWNLISGEEQRRLPANMGPGAIAVSADGSLSVTGARVDGRVWVWDLQTGALLHHLQGHYSGMTAVSISADGTRAVTGGGEGTVRVWYLRSGENLLELSGHVDEVWSVAVSADGSRVVTGGPEETARVWNLASGQRLLDLPGHTGGVTAVAISADNYRVVTGGRDGTVRVWNLTSGEQLFDLRRHSDGVLAIAISPDGTRAVTGGRDGTIRVWDQVSGEHFEEFPYPRYIDALAVVATPGASFELVTGDVYGAVTRCTLLTQSSLNAVMEAELNRGRRLSR